jgi:DNA-binding beta-propeller fold protein YncE
VNLARWCCSLVLFFLLLRPVLAQETILHDADHYELAAQWDDPGVPSDGSKEPSMKSTKFHACVAVDSKGNVYVANEATLSIQKYGPDGKLLASLKIPKGSCECVACYVIAVGPRDHLYVGDGCCDRLLEYDPDGNLVNTIGGPGKTKLFTFVGGIAVESSGNVLMTDGKGVQELSADSQKLRSFGKKGFWPGEFLNPGRLGLDAAGNLFVGDGWNQRIQVFNSKGQFLREIGDSGPAEARVNFPGNFRVGEKGDLFMLGKQVKWLDPTGQWVKNFELRGYPSFSNSPFGAMTMDAQGNVYLVHYDESRIFKFSPVKGPATLSKATFTPTGTPPWPVALHVPSEEIPPIDLPTALALDSKGFVCVLDQGIEIRSSGSAPFRQSRLVRFGPDLKPLAVWGHPPAQGSRESLNSPLGVCVDAQDNVYVADTQNHRVQKFDPAGLTLTIWGPDGKAEESDWLPVGIVTDLKGNVFVSDLTHQEIRKFDPSGNLLLKWGGPGQAQGKFDDPYGLACDASGHVYVADTGNDRVQKFSNEGKFLASWGGKGESKGRFQGPRAVALGSDGKVWVADMENHRFQAFEVTGKWLATRPVSGDPESIDLDKQGRIFWVDEAAHQVKVLDTDGAETLFGLDMQTGAMDQMGGALKLADGNFLLTEYGKVYIYAPDGKWLGTWTSETPQSVREDHGVHYYGKLDVRPNGEIWILQGRGNRLEIMKFDEFGKSLGNIEGEEFDKPTGGGVRFTVAGWDSPFSPGISAFDSNGNLYVADASNYRIEKFDSQANRVKTWGQRGTGNGDFQWLTGLVVDSKDRIYTLESESGRVQIFDPEGHLLGHWNSTIEQPSKGVNYPYRFLFLSAAGNLWVNQFVSGGTELKGYSPDGRFLKRVGFNMTASGFNWGPDGNFYFAPGFPKGEVWMIPADQLDGPVKK